MAPNELMNYSKSSLSNSSMDIIERHSMPVRLYSCMSLKLSLAKSFTIKLHSIKRIPSEYNLAKSLHFLRKLIDLIIPEESSKTKEKKSERRKI